MRSSISRYLLAVILLVLLPATVVSAERNDPVSGEQLEYWINQQHPEMQAKLMELFPESEGYLVTGPQCDPVLADDTANIRAPLRIITTDLGALSKIIQAVRADSLLSEDFDNEHDGTWKRPLIDHQSRGRTATFTLRYGNHERVFVRFSTWHQERFGAWLAEQPTPLSSALQRYAPDLSEYLFKLDQGKYDKNAPEASDYGLSDSTDFYAEPPDYVIEGYTNYLNFLERHKAIHTSFADGVTAFVPSDSLLAELKSNAPSEAYPNKEWPMLQREYRKFFERGGDPGVMQTLTGEGFDTLKAGEYFFAVGLTGRIRFGRELLRAEVDRIEQETGHKVPRANHAFLFPGELILTAGAFFVESSDEGPRLVKVTAQSGHYFYSNVSKTIREDIAVNSNRYLLTLGHLFVSLDSLDIPYEGVLISKF